MRAPRHLLALLLTLAACVTQPFPPVDDGGDVGDGAIGTSSVPCLNASCATSGGQVCCVSQRSFTGTCEPGPCGPNNFTFTCDGPEDCPGQRCCMDALNSRTLCLASCGMFYDLCHTDGDCAPNQPCGQLEFGPPSLFACTSG